MIHQIVAHFLTRARQEINDTRRQADLFQRLHEFGGNDRGGARRLQYNGVAGNDGRRGHAGHNREREVPRRNDDADAKRDVIEMILFLFVNRQRLGSAQAPHFACIEFHEIDRLGRIRVGFGTRLAGFESHERGELELAPPHDRRALNR